jgi:3,4-dihydroxy-9,10-secoandrosta-1,3,5(10)-triene-9,17-dione 4,5-dioxygenase
MDERAWRFRIEKQDSEAYLAAGLECPDQVSFDATLTALKAAGAEVRVGSADEVSARNVKGLATCNDPSGNTVELCWGQANASTPFASPIKDLSFITANGGLGHVVVPALKLAATRTFYNDLLGFGDSDEMKLQMGDHTMGMHFLHGTGPRHHVVALAEFPAPSGLVHVMVEAKNLDDVGLALDRAIGAGCHISSSLGKHTNDKMVSFYVRSPTGFDVEFGYGGVTPDWKTFVPTVTEQADYWGHRWDFGA